MVDERCGEEYLHSGAYSIKHQLYSREVRREPVDLMITWLVKGARFANQMLYHIHLVQINDNVFSPLPKLF